MTEFMFSSLMIYSGLYHQAAPNPNQSTRCVKQKEIKRKIGSDYRIALENLLFLSHAKKDIKKKRRSDYQMLLEKLRFLNYNVIAYF